MTKYPVDENTKYMTELCVNFKYVKNLYPKRIFERAVYKEFEGHLMPVPVGYDQYLRMAFGDYMQLPPKDERVPKHDAVFVDLNNSYKEYKGIYYCVEK